MAVLADHGQEIKPWGDDKPAILAIDLEVVRSQFYKIHPAAEATDAAGKHQARKKAFGRVVKDARADDLIGTWVGSDRGVGAGRRRRSASSPRGHRAGV
jgi:hypothetical protein